MHRLEKIKLVRNIVMLGLISGYLYNYVFNGLILRKGYPANTFFPPPNWDFADFLFHTFITRGLSPYLNTGVSLKSNFPPFMHLLIWPTTLPDPVIALMVFSFIFVGFCGWIGMRYLKGNSTPETAVNIVGIIFCSYPFLFALVRGNYEIYAFFLMCLALMTYPKWRSAVLIGMAAACKIFPAVFALLFLDRKNYPKFILVVLTVSVLTAVSFLVLNGGVTANIVGFRHMMETYHQYYVLNAHGLAFNHSLYGALLVVTGTASMWMASIYFKTTVMIGIVILFLVIRESLLWKKLALIVIMMTLLPYVSGDYKLLHFFLPLFVFLEAQPAHSDRIYCWLFGLIMVPKAWFFFGNGDVSSSVLVNPLLITGLLFVIAEEHFVILYVF